MQFTQSSGAQLEASPGRSAAGRACPVCESEVEAEDLFFRWFEAERYASGPTLEALRSSQGFCQRHARRLLLGVSAWPATRIPAATMVASARTDVIERRAPSAQCPACAAIETHTGAVIHDLFVVRRSGFVVPLCLRHLRQAIDTAEHLPPTGLSKLQARVADHDWRTVAAIGGVDGDGQTRRQLRSKIADDPPAATTLAGLEQRLQVEACPICAASGQAERRYLDWLPRTLRDDPDVVRREGLTLCDRHLVDLSLHGPDVLPTVLPHLRVRIVAALTDELTARLRAHRRRLRSHPERTPIQRDCTVCRAVAGIERRQLELLQTALAQPGVLARYRAGHGICLRHFQLAAPAADQILADQLSARLALLAWEVEEDRAKHGWDTRFDPPGDERTAWARVLTQIDGMVTLGLPARAALADEQL